MNRDLIDRYAAGEAKLRPAITGLTGEDLCGEVWQ